MTLLEWTGAICGARLLLEFFFRPRQHRAEQVWRNARRWSNN